MSMETNDNPSAQRSPLLDSQPLHPSSLEFLADWEIRELILWLEAEQRRREQARWEEAERVRRENPRPCFHCTLVLLATAWDLKSKAPVQLIFLRSFFRLCAVFTALLDLPIANTIFRP